MRLWIDVAESLIEGDVLSLATAVVIGGAFGLVLWLLQITFWGYTILFALIGLLFDYHVSRNYQSAGSTAWWAGGNGFGSSSSSGSSSFGGFGGGSSGGGGSSSGW